MGFIHRGCCVGVIDCGSERSYDFRDNGTRQVEDNWLLLTKVPCELLRSLKLFF